MSSPRHHIIDIEHSKSIGEASTRPVASSALAENLRDRLAITEHEPDHDGQETVIKNNVESTRDGGRPGLPPLFFIGTPDDIPKGDTDIRRNSMIDDAHFRRVGYSGEILKYCSQCKRKIPENTDVYMYGYDPRAYCSIDCRKKQMASDGYQIDIVTTSDGEDRVEDKQNSRCH